MIEHVYNYPNPFTTKTSFQFEHNQSCNNLDVQIQVFTISGKLVKSINKTVNTIGFRIEGIEWDGKDDFGDNLAKGVYIYRLSVKNNLGEQAEKTEKLVLLK
jgi:flagellar hook assembly protein FlgD